MIYKSNSFIQLMYLRTWLANIRQVRIRIFMYVPSLKYDHIRCPLHGTFYRGWSLLNEVFLVTFRMNSLNSSPPCGKKFRGHLSVLNLARIRNLCWHWCTPFIFGVNSFPSSGKNIWVLNLLKVQSRIYNHCWYWWCWWIDPVWSILQVISLPQLITCNLSCTSYQPALET